MHCGAVSHTIKDRLSDLDNEMNSKIQENVRKYSTKREAILDDIVRKEENNS